MTPIKLFIPGPVQVSEKTMRAFAQPMIGHRSKAFQDLNASVQPRLQQLFYTKQPVLVSTSSAWGVMEASIRNLVAKKVLICMNGAFSDKWFEVARHCGKEADKLQVDWGKPILADDIEAKLKEGGFDAIAMIHNETSSGTMSELEKISAVMRRFPEVCWIVDAVSSLSAVPILFDELGIDVLLAGTQKALALPPGAALFAASEKAYEKASHQKDRGYYFDFLEFQKNQAVHMTPSTPSISHFYALQSKLEDIFDEGLEERYRRHLEMAALTRAWALERGFALFPNKGCESVTLTCVKNTRGIDVANLNQTLRERYKCIIDEGYGKIKGLTFRIAHMGDETPGGIQQLLGWMDECLKTL